MTKTSSVLFVVALALLLSAPSDASSHYQIVALADLSRGDRLTPEDMKSGSLLLHSDGYPAFVAAPSAETVVRIGVAGTVARVRVEQVFRNPSDEWVEGVYVFPLPERAEVDSLRIEIGERIIVGQIREKGKRRTVDPEADRRGGEPFPLEQERSGAFTTQVAGIGPTEDVRVELEYQEDVGYQGGRFELRFPMSAAPRYVAGELGREHVAFSGTRWTEPADILPDADRAVPPTPHSRRARESLVDLEVQLDVGTPLAIVESRSHDARVEQMAGFRYIVRPGDGAVPAARDFTLSWEPDVGTAPKATLSTERPAAYTKTPVEPSGLAGRLLALLAFLALIFGLLIHWSGDQSCQEERSVYSPSR